MYRKNVAIRRFVQVPLHALKSTYCDASGIAPFYRRKRATSTERHACAARPGRGVMRGGHCGQRSRLRRWCTHL